MNWQRFLKGRLKKEECLARHTSFKVGGPVQFWIEPGDLSDLQKVVLIAGKRKMPLRIIGAGSNILASDKGIKGIVVKLNFPYFKRIHPHTNLQSQCKTEKQVGVGLNQQIISAGAGLSLARLLRCAQENGLSGFELLAGIPGTVGGALIMNAANIGDNVLDVTVMDKQARVKILNREDIQFSYRSSSLNRYIILSARFKLIYRDRRAINKRINRYLDYRQKTQDLSKPSAGCIFKNPPPSSRLPSSPRLRRISQRIVHRSFSEGGQNSKSAAYFIERCGLKGSSFGDAAVSFKHANFIVNKGRASYSDILRLIVYITKYVKKRFNLNLEPEIKIWR